MRDREVIVIVPVRRSARGTKVLALPKGHPDGSETAEEAATREVFEEAGAKVKLIEKLGDVRYSYERNGRKIDKRVAFFLFRYVSGDVADHDHEIEDARWMPLEEAAEALSYEGEREMVARTLSRISADR